MPHVDELLGVATIAAAGMFAAIALQPVMSGASGTAAAAEVPVATAAAHAPVTNAAAQAPVGNVAANAAVKNAAARTDLPGTRGRL